MPGAGAVYNHPKTGLTFKPWSLAVKEQPSLILVDLQMMFGPILDETSNIIRDGETT